MIEQLRAMPKYEAYKESGESWISEIPEHWEIRKLKQIFYEKKHKKNTYLNCGSISYGKVVIKDDEKIPYSTKESYQEVLKGEFLINPLNLNYDLISLRIALSYIDVVVSPGYIVLKTHKNINKEYFKYLLHRYDVAYMKLLGSGVRQTINFSHIANSILLFPPSPEQTAIAAFLNRKTAQIDQAVAIKEKQIALLKERKQILIQNAVTRGLNPDAPMRDSGVEWIREIPAHWDIKKLKYIVRFVSGATPSKDRAEYWNGIIPWISPKDMKRLRIDSSIDFVTDMAIKKSNIRLLDIGTILIVVRGMILAKKIPVALSKVPLTINQDMKGLIPDPICLPEYLLYLLDGINGQISTLLEDSGHGTKTLPTEKFGQLPLGIPPKYEQISIISYIEIESARVDKAIAIQQQQIDKFKEYKATLINSTVTGKIKVPELVEERVSELAEVPMPKPTEGALVEASVA